MNSACCRVRRIPREKKKKNKEVANGIQIPNQDKT